MTVIDKKYFAFISYKREDEAWAKWLQHKLEHYKLPSNLNGRSDLPKEIRPIFRDTSDLAGGVLAEEIKNALENSQYLIVICSPRAAQSEWVGKEVQSFIEMGRIDKIIPFIVGGAPYSENVEEECFPLSLRKLPKEQELLGVNINEMGRDAAAVKVIARMFGLRFDDLWQRHEREQRRKRFLTIGAALLLALIGVGVAVGFSRQNKRISEQNDKIVLQNEEISKKSNEVLKQNAEITKKNERLWNDSIIMAAQLDSINRRDALIKKQQDSISRTNKNLATANRSLESANKKLETAKGNLETANEQLEQERDQLEKTLWKMKENQSQIVAKSLQPLAKEDSYLAKKIAVEILPKDINNPVDRPYTAEAEQALRKISEYDNAIFKYKGNVRFVSYSKDGTKIYCIVENTVVVLNPDNGEELLKKDFPNLTDVDMDYDGTQIAVATDSVIKILDIATGEFVKNTGKHNNKVYNVAFHPDGTRILSLALDSTMRVWSASTGEELFKIDNCYSDVFEDDDVRKITFFAPDGKQIIFAASVDGYSEEHIFKDIAKKGRYHTFYFFDAETGEKLNSWKCKADVFDINFICNEIALVSNSTMDVFFCDIYSGKELGRLRRAIGTAKSISLSPDGKNFASSAAYEHKESRIVVKETDNLKHYNYWNAHNSIINVVSYSPDGNSLISCSKDGTIKIWGIKPTGKSKLLSKFEDYNKEKHYEAYISVDKKTMIYKVDIRGEFYFKWCFFDIEKGVVHNYLKHVGYKDIVLNPDGASGVMFDPINGLNVFDFFDIKESVYNKSIKEKGYEPLLFISYTHDGKYLIVSREDFIRFIDIETCTEIKRLPEKGVTSFVYSSDMRQIALTRRNEKFVTILNPETFEKIKVLEGNTSFVNYACFSHNGNYVAGNDMTGNVNLWDTESGIMIYALKGFLNQNNSSFSQNDKYLITKVDDKTLNVWELKTGNCMYVITNEDKFILDYTFVDDDRYIIVAYDNGEIRQYDFPPLQELIDQTRERFKNRPLTEEERKMYYLE